jgi:hypothetical protein
METLWVESYFPKDQAEYDRWSGIREWFEQANLWTKPLVRHDFDDSSEFDGNAYGKGGLVLYMLRHQIGEEAFYRGLKHYLEVNRGKNVVTADLVKAIEEGWLNNWIRTDFKGGKKNKDLWLQYYHLAKKQFIRFVWVKGHANNPFTLSPANESSCRKPEKSSGRWRHLVGYDCHAVARSETAFGLD